MSCYTHADATKFALTSELYQILHIDCYGKRMDSVGNQSMVVCLYPYFYNLAGTEAQILHLKFSNLTETLFSEMA